MMARIRSIHPGLFTDEAFVSVSPMARILLIGIWTEAWDDGVFEWKPRTLKMKIFPADNTDVDQLLQELQQFNCIKKVERNGKSYGFVRNFRKYQRPKKPNSSGISTPKDADYLGPEHKSGEKGASDTDDEFPTDSEPVPHQSGTSTVIAKQMEDGGWRREEEINKSIEAKASLVGFDFQNTTTIAQNQIVFEKPEPEPDRTQPPSKPANARKPSKKNSYTPEFSNLWHTWDVHPNESKSLAFERFNRLSEPEKSDCFDGVMAYGEWHKAECQKRRGRDPPERVHLSTFISQKRWETLLSTPFNRYGRNPWKPHQPFSSTAFSSQS